MRCRYAAMLGPGLGACAGAGADRGPAAPAAPDAHPARDRIRASPALVLDTPVHGTTTDPVPGLGATCTGGGGVGKLSARGYRFVAPETATYRFAVRADYPAVLEIARFGDAGSRTLILGCEGRQTFDMLVTLRAGETYAAIVDGHLQAQGSFELAVRLDASPGARIHPEDPAHARALLAAAPALPAGRTSGTFESVASGAPDLFGVATAAADALAVGVAGTIVHLHAPDVEIPVGVGE